VGEVIAIDNKHIRAVEGADIPTLTVSGVVGADFSGAMLAQAIEYYAKDGSDVRIVLDSVGGYASDAFHFYDYVRANALRVFVDGYGTVASAATIIMAAAGRKRSRISENTEYLIHNAVGGDAEQVARTNVKMANIYAELTGKDRKELLAIMKRDKAMSAKDAVKMGFVGSIIQNQALAAKSTIMEQTKEKRVIALSASQRLAAITTGEVEVDIDVDAEMAEQVSAYAKEVNDLKAQLDEVKAEAEAKDEAVKAKADAEAKLAEERNALKAVTEEAERLKAEITKLKTTPLANAVKGGGDTVVDPPAHGGAQAPVKEKLTAQERASAFAEALRSRTKPA
jgi:ATP-dependent Clp protease protease subunit